MREHRRLKTARRAAPDAQHRVCRRDARRRRDHHDSSEVRAERMRPAALAIGPGAGAKSSPKS